MNILALKMGRKVKIGALTVVLAASSGSLAACGKTGPLAQPAPLFGAKAKADYDAEQKAKSEAQAAKRAQPRADAPDPATAPLTQAPFEPIPGRTAPGGSPAPGALPNTGTPGGQ